MATAANHVIPRFLPLRLPKVCVAVIGRDAPEMAQKAETLVRDNPFLDFRFDYLSKPGLSLPKTRKSMEVHPNALCIATPRRASGRGQVRGAVAPQLRRLAKDADAGR